MELKKTTWDWREGGNDLAESHDVMEQPGFGFQLIWNEPHILYKPCLVLHFWRWRLQIGWLIA